MNSRTRVLSTTTRVDENSQDFSKCSRNTPGLRLDIYCLTTRVDKTTTRVLILTTRVLHDKLELLAQIYIYLSAFPFSRYFIRTLTRVFSNCSLLSALLLSRFSPSFTMRTKNPNTRHLPSSPSTSEPSSKSSESSSPSSDHSPPSKKARTEKLPTRPYRPKVAMDQPSPKPKAKGVVIREPSDNPHRTRSKSGDTTDKGKGKSVKFAEPKKSSHRASQSTSGSSKIPSLLAIARNPIPPPGFLCNPLSIPESDLTNYLEDFGVRNFCPAISVNFPTFHNECNLDLTPWLHSFQPLLSLSCPFSPSVVRTFYYYMRIDNDYNSNSELVQERIYTIIRGKRINISADILNSALGVVNPPPVPTIDFSEEEIFKILRPGEPLGPLSFTPVEMPPLNRVLWYIYSRNLVQKGKNFTHFAHRDYYLLAAIISQIPFNLGQWLFDEIRRFRFMSQKKSHIPFPNLVSLILFHNKIWYLELDEKPVKPRVFGQSHLNYMRISFQEGSGQSKAPTKSRATSTRQEDETHTSPVATPSVSTHAPPSMFGASLQNMVEKAVQKSVDSLAASMLASFHQLTEDLETQIGKLVSEINSNYNRLVDTQEEHSQRLQQIEDTQARHTRIFQQFEDALVLMGFTFHKPAAAEAGPSGTAHEPPSSDPVPTAQPAPAHVHHISSSTSSSTATAPLSPDPSSISPHSPFTTPLPVSTTPPPTTSILTPSTTLAIYTPPPDPIHAPVPIQIVPPSDPAHPSDPSFLPDDKGGEE